jgi:hypothetical protein
VDLQRAMDEIKAREPALIFALVIDLNSYGPIHNREFCKDWTGVREKDLAGNRIKRFFTDQRVLVRGARVGLPQAQSLPDRARRQDFIAAGCDLKASDEGRGQFLVQTYARDTGRISTAHQAPIKREGSAGARPHGVERVGSPSSIERQGVERYQIPRYPTVQTPVVYWKSNDKPAAASSSPTTARACRHSGYE